MNTRTAVQQHRRRWHGTVSPARACGHVHGRRYPDLRRQDHSTSEVLDALAVAQLGFLAAALGAPGAGAALPTSGQRHDLTRWSGALCPPDEARPTTPTAGASHRLLFSARMWKAGASWRGTGASTREIGRPFACLKRSTKPGVVRARHPPADWLTFHRWRRACTAAASSASNPAEASHPRQASVMLQPYCNCAASSLPGVNFCPFYTRWLSTMMPNTLQRSGGNLLANLACHFDLFFMLLAAVGVAAVHHQGGGQFGLSSSLHAAAALRHHSWGLATAQNDVAILVAVGLYDGHLTVLVHR